MGVRVVFSIIMGLANGPGVRMDDFYLTFFDGIG